MLKRTLITVLILLACAALASVLRSLRDTNPLAADRLGGATDLSESLEPLREEFNQHHDRPRLLAVLSPACPVCLEGAEAIRQEIVVAHPEIDVLLVWVEVLPYDITRNPRRRVELFAGAAQVEQFYDASQKAGVEVSMAVRHTGMGPAWDVYLFYPPGERWQERLPRTGIWFHQQRDFASERYRTGEDLRRALRTAAESLDGEVVGARDR